MSVYLIVAVFGLIYVGTLVLLNHIPKVSVKSLGWFCIKHVSIDLGSMTVHIGKLKLRFHIFRASDSPHKFVNIEFFDVTVTLHKAEPHPSQKPEVKKLKPKTSLREKLDKRMYIPKVLYDFLLVRQIINHVHIDLFRCTFNNDEFEDTSVVIDFCRLENIYSKPGVNQVLITLLKGHLMSSVTEENDIRLFRDIRFSLVWDTIFSCSTINPSHIFLGFTNFAIHFSSSNLVIPFKTLETIKAKKLEKFHKAAKEKEQEKPLDGAPPSDAVEKKPLDIDYDGIGALIEKLKVIDIRLEDLETENELGKLKVSTFIFSYEKKNFFDFKVHSQTSFYITAFKIYHLDTKCFELPSATLTYEFKPFAILDCLQRDNTLAPDDLPESKIIFTFSNPTVDVYYDQVDRFLSISKMSRKKEKPIPDKHVIHNHVLKALGSPLARYFASKIVFVDLNIRLHLPHPDHTEFHRLAKSNIIVAAKFLSLFYRWKTQGTRRKLQTYNPKDYKVQHFFKLRNFRLSVADNTINLSKVKMILNYNILEDKLSVKNIIKNIEIKSVNTIIFHMVRFLRNRNVVHYNKKCAHMMQCQDKIPKETVADPTNEEDIVSFIELFKVLPSYVGSVKTYISSILADIICNDGLPEYRFFDSNMGEEVNLADFKRGVSFKISDAFLAYKLDKEEIFGSIESVHCFTSSDYLTEIQLDFDEVVGYYRDDEDSLSEVSSIESQTFDNDISSDLGKIKKVLSIRNITLSNTNNSDEDKNRLKVSIPEIDGRIDIFLVWCFVYAATLLKYFAPTVPKEFSKTQAKALKLSHSKLKLDIFINLVTLICRLPNMVDILLELDTMSLRNVTALENICLKYARLYVVHPSTKIWARLITITNPQFHPWFNKEDADWHIDVVSKTIRLSIPHQFLVYTVIDNIITMAKAVKQIKQNFTMLSHDDKKFERIYPEAKPAILLPHINVKADNFGLVIESDPFENELSHIFELGLLEQRLRIQKRKMFEKKVEGLLKYAKLSPEDLTYSQPGKRVFSTATAPKYTSPLRNVFTGLSNGSKSNNTTNVVTETNGMTREEAQKKIDDAMDLLNQEISMSWITKFRKFRKVKIESWSRRTSKVWGEEKFNPLLLEKFRIQQYADGPDMMTGNFNDLDLTISKAHIPDVDEFLFKHGKGQPKLEYSILIPMFIRIHARSLWFFLRDYALPLLSFPECRDDPRKTIDFQGNIVINEKLVTRKEEMRFIFVPFSPAIPKMEFEDNFYALYVPRTLTPVKFMMDLDCKLDSDRSCILNYCKSYLAALLSALTALDNFTKPEIDDSPIGWWDKMALLAHGKVSFDITNEICLHMKSSLSPYHMIGKASGFVFSWKNNVSLQFNPNQRREELILLKSDDFMLAVPNYSVAEKKSWSLFYDKLDDMDDDLDGHRKYLKKVMKLASDEKVNWTLGFTFERNKHDTTELSDQQERTTHFKPHYDIVVTNPEFEWHPDSYEGYRSDYLHLAISVASKSAKGNAYNAGYLTPITFQYFYYWWDTISEGISLPIKQGPLFNTSPVKKSHIKMSPHLMTVKYQLILQPFIISHTYMHSTGKLPDDSYRVAFTGMKGKFDSCTLDLHQRKELVRYVNEKLNIDNRVPHLKTNRGEVDISVADVRFINAVFTDKSSLGELAGYLMNGQISNPNTKYEATDFFNSQGRDNTFEGFSNSDGNFNWIDLEDFSELEILQTLSPNPKVSVSPFFFTPRFTFFREFSLQVDGPYPFGNEHVHECLLGKLNPVETQSYLLDERIKKLKITIREKDDLVKKLVYANDSEFAKETAQAKLDLKVAKEKLEVVRSIWENMTGEEAVYTSDEESISITKVNTNALSVYSYQHPMEQMREVATMNSGASDFHSRFIFHNLQLRWDNNLRDHFMDYIQKVSDRKSQVYFMSKKAVDLVEGVLKEQDLSDANSTKEEAAEDDDGFGHKSAEEVIDGFEEVLSEIDDHTQECENKYLLKLIHPQIQLISNKDPNSCVIIASKDVELRNVDINLKGMNDIISESTKAFSTVESRYGALFKDAHMFVFKKDESTVTHPDIHYGVSHSSSDINWPPWLECEVCYDSSWVQNQLVVERNTMAAVINKPNLLFSESQNTKQSNGITVNLAKLVINANSEQYSTLYYVTTDLLVHGKTARDELINRLDKVMALSDSSDFEGLDERVVDLQQQIRFTHNLLLKLDNTMSHFNSRELQQLSFLEMERDRMVLELGVIMRSLTLRSSKQSATKRISRYWNIISDQIIWHLLNEDREPFIDFAIASASFSRKDSYEGSNINKLEIAMIQGFNLQTNAIYPELLRPDFETDKKKNPQNAGKDVPIIRLLWKMLHPIGGITIMQHAELHVRPLKVQLDYETTKMLFHYLFPKEEGDSSESDPDDSDLINDSESIAESDIGKKKHKNPFRQLLSKNRSSSDVSDKGSVGSDRGSRIFDSRPPSIASDSLSGTFDSTSTGSSAKAQAAAVIKKVQHKKNDNNNEEEDYDDDIAVIMDRSSKYISIVDIEVSKMEIAVSFKAPRHLNILDVYNLKMTIPTLKYTNKMWSGKDLILRLKKDIIKVIIHHSGKIIGSKFKHRKRNSITEPLKQISNYAAFTSLQDLQQDGRSRDAAKTDNNGHAEHKHHHHHHHRHAQVKREPSHLSKTFQYEGALDEILDEEDDEEEQK